MPRTALVLHGGGGPATVAPLAAALASGFATEPSHGFATEPSHGFATEPSHGFAVEAPTHPGWNGTEPVPGDTVAALAGRYLADLRARGLRDAVVIGSSIGGWLAAELAAQDAAVDPADRVLGAIVLVDAFGIAVPGQEQVDFSGLDARGLAERAWADPDRGFIDPATLTAEQKAVGAGNRAALALYGGPGVGDAGLYERLASIVAPTLVVWGDADRMATPDYGRALAAAIPDARFELIAAAGHLPHLEQPEATLAAIRAFVGVPGRQ